MRAMLTTVFLLLWCVAAALAQTHTVTWVCNANHGLVDGNPPLDAVDGYTVTVQPEGGGAAVLSHDAGKPSCADDGTGTQVTSTDIDLSALATPQSLEAVVTATGPSGSESTPPSAPFTYPAQAPPSAPAPMPDAPTVADFQ